MTTHQTYILFGILVILSACHQNPKENKAQLPKNNSSEVEHSLVPTSNAESILGKTFKQFTLYSLNDTIKTDLNGDGVSDLAFWNQLKQQKSLVVIDGRTKLKQTIGSDSTFHEIGNNFSWEDTWGTTNDSETFEVIFSETNDIEGTTQRKLKNTSIFVRLCNDEDDGGGGIVTYLDGRYQWIHQAD